MRTLWSLVLLAAVLSDALNLAVVSNEDKKAPLRFMRRDVPYSNGTINGLDVTTTSSSTAYSSTTDTSSTISLSTTTSPSIFGPLTPLPYGPTSSTTTSTTTLPTSTSRITSILTNATTSTIPAAPPLRTTFRLPPYTGVFTNESTSIDLNVTTPAATCTGSITYMGSVPPTVYVTVTEGFDVTVTASNVSVTETPTLITPLPACSATILPMDGSFIPSDSTAAPSKTNLQGPQVQATNNPFSELPPAPPPGNSPAVATGAPDASPSASGAVYSSVDYTSTVVVTKKTPVTVVVPPTSSLDINFNFPTPTPTPSPSNSGGSGGSNNGGQNGNGGSSGNTGGGADKTSPTEGSGNSPAPNTPAATSPNIFASIGNVGSTGGSLVINTGTPTSLGLGNIIASIINSPFATASPPTRAAVPAAAAPLTTTLGGIPVLVLPSDSVAIGGQTVAIPNLAPTTVQVSGIVFTIGPSQIVAPSATITLVQPQREQVVTPVPTATITTTVGDLTLTVGPTAAIISGTTYRIGSGAPATTVVVDGTSVSIGAGGVGLPSTTVAPGGVSGSPFTVYTTQGLTFSVGNTVAIVGGTTYRVGSDAPEVTATIGPDHATVSFGPGGVGLASTTLAPGGSPFVVVTADGLTFSVDGTEAIISGTTYRIGPNAPIVTTNIGTGHTSVSFGPGGVGLKSTTILPTATSAQTSETAKTASRSTSAIASSTQSAASGSGALTLMPISGLSARCLVAMSFVWLAL